MAMGREGNQQDDLIVSWAEMPRSPATWPRHLCPAHDQIVLLIALAPHRHVGKSCCPPVRAKSMKPDFVNGLLRSPSQTYHTLPVSARLEAAATTERSTGADGIGRNSGGPSNLALSRLSHREIRHLFRGAEPARTGTLAWVTALLSREGLPVAPGEPGAPNEQGGVKRASVPNEQHAECGS